MDITQLSKNGYRINNIFPEEFLPTLQDLSTNFESTDRRPGYRDESYRISYEVIGDLKNRLSRYFKPTLLSFTGRITSDIAIELWRDYGGYYNLWHIDFPNVHNVIIVYLDDNMPATLGTQYEEDGEIYSVPYKKNSALVLLNSNQTNHGMIAPVPVGTVRRTLYLNWKSQDE
jgi:hypothetical protein